jgi:hypothetical protein
VTRTKLNLFHLPPSSLWWNESALRSSQSNPQQMRLVFLYILCRISLSRPGAPVLCKRLWLSTRFELSAPWSEAPLRCSQVRWFWRNQFLRIWGFWNATSIIVCCSELEFDSDVSNLFNSDIEATLYIYIYICIMYIYYIYICECVCVCVRVTPGWSTAKHKLKPLCI